MRLHELQRIRRGLVGVPGTANRSMDLPRFGGRVRSWVYSMGSGGDLSSCFQLFLCSAPTECVPPSRSARFGGRRAQGRSRSAVAPGLTHVPTCAGRALYEAFEVKRYFTAFFTFFLAYPVVTHTPNM